MGDAAQQPKMSPGKINTFALQVHIDGVTKATDGMIRKLADQWHASVKAKDVGALRTNLNSKAAAVEKSMPDKVRSVQEYDALLGSLATLLTFHTTPVATLNDENLEQMARATSTLAGNFDARRAKMAPALRYWHSSCDSPHWLANATLQTQSRFTVMGATFWAS